MRELRDQLRDRRTLFIIIVLPLLLYPGMGIGMVQLTVLFSDQPRTVVVLGDEYLPEAPSPLLLDGNRFQEDLFFQKQHAAKLNVLTERSLKSTASAEQTGQDALDAKLLTRAYAIRDKLPLRDQLEAAIVAIEGGTALSEPERSRLPALQKQLTDLNEQLGRQFSSSKIQVLVIVPQDFDKHLSEANHRLADRTDRLQAIADYQRPRIVHNSADEKSQITFNRVKKVLAEWEDKILEQRLELANLPADLHQPVKPQNTDLALDVQVAAKLWSQIFPALLVIMSATGAFYPAVDLAAGEKERGTMETLLICPATRIEIVLGKFFTVMSFSITTALLNLLSMGTTGRYMVEMVGTRGLGQTASVPLPSLIDVLWIVALLIPLAAMFSALCLALATFARSSKEGQYYLTPLLMVTLGLTLFCLSPGVELTPMYSVIPIAGVALLLKGLLLSSMSSGALYVYTIPVLATTVLYSFLALWWAIDQFNREDVLFREAERFELGLWIRHLLRDKEPLPSFSEAVFCFVLIMLLQFASFSVAGSAGSSPESMIRVLIITQIAIIASPALFMGVMLTTSLVRTFRIRLPSLGMVGAAVVLGVVLHPLSMAMLENLSWFFPPLPAEMQQRVGTLMSPDQPLWYVLLAMAIAPAVCEEIAFRGFILSGLNRRGRTWLAITMSSIAFGLMHMIPQQVFNASLLGLVLGIIAVRSNSLLPCIAFHFTFNLLGVLHGRLDQSHQVNLPDNPFIYLENNQLHYQWPTLVVATLLAAPLLWWLARGVKQLHKPTPQQTQAAQPQVALETGVHS